MVPVGMGMLFLVKSGNLAPPRAEIPPPPPNAGMDGLGGAGAGAADIVGAGANVDNDRNSVLRTLFNLHFPSSY